jgi:hypothetical protein
MNLAVFQMEMTDLLCDADPRTTFRHVRLLEFHKICFHADKFPVLSDHARRMTSLSGCTCVCKEFLQK